MSLGFMVEGLGIQDLGFRVWDSRFWAQGLAFMQASGFRI